MPILSPGEAQNAAARIAAGAADPIDYGVASVTPSTGGSIVVATNHMTPQITETFASLAEFQSAHEPT